MKNNEIKIRLKLGDPPTEQSLAYSEVVHIIKQHLDFARYHPAAALAKAVARALPQDLAMQLYAADALVLNKEPQKAVEFADRARSIGNDPVPGLFIKSRIELQLNQPDKALSCLDQVIRLRPDNSDFYFERGDLFLAIGDLPSARRDFMRSLELNSRHAKSLHHLSLLPDHGVTKNTLRKMEFLLDSSQLTPLEQADAHFALANFYRQEDIAQEQFRHLHAGNAIMSGLYNYQPGPHRKDIDDIIAFFSAEFLDRPPVTGCRSERLIFIIGMPRSGSTLAEQILCSHSQVSSAGENPYIVSAVNNFSRQYAEGYKFPQSITKDSIHNLSTIAHDYVASLQPLDSNGVIVDKTLGNYLFPGLISLIFPNARFIYTRRHPVATCYGCYSRIFAKGAVPYSYNLDHLATQYRDSQEIINHWKRVLPEKIYTLDYEKLVRSQEDVSRALLAHCELPWEAQCLQFHQNSATVTTASNLQVRKRLYTSAINHWEQYRDYLAPVLGLVEDY